MIVAFGYIRVSSKGQVQGDGLTRQSQALKRYAKMNDIHIAHTFREEGVSGTKDLQHRPAFVEMLSLAPSRGVKVLLIEKLDRLARDLVVQESILAELRENGLQLVSVEEPDLLGNDPVRIMFRQFMGAIAQYDKTSIVLKLRAARQRKKAAHGRCEGRRPYGDREGEQDVLKMMVALRQGGLSYRQIAARLTAEGNATRGGKPWRGYTVNLILHRIGSCK